MVYNNMLNNIMEQMDYNVMEYIRTTMTIIQHTWFFWPEFFGHTMSFHHHPPDITMSD